MSGDMGLITLKVDFVCQSIVWRGAKTHHYTYLSIEPLTWRQLMFFISILNGLWDVFWKVPKKGIMGNVSKHLGTLGENL